jgi:adenylate cyclase
MSAEAEDDYFADGVAEDIITALSHVPWIFVIARNSSFSFKGLSVDMRKIGRDLGVRYVLEGSVRRSGARLRVTGQLIDAGTGAHIWAERYDGVVEDIFDLQDRISESVVAAIAPEIQTAEIRRGLRKPPDNLDAYDMCLRGQNALHLGRMAEADDWLARAADAAPDFAKARALRAWIGTLSHLYGKSPAGEHRRALLALAEDALAAQPDDPEVVAYAGYAAGFLGRDPRRGLVLVEQATQRCPSFAWAWASSSMLSAYLGLADQALERAAVALRLSPRDPLAFRVYTAMVIAHFLKGDHAAHLDCCVKGAALNPRSMNFQYHRAIALTELGRLDEAAEARSRTLDLAPDFSVGKYIRYVVDNIGVADVLARRMEDGLRKAGFPE